MENQEIERTDKEKQMERLEKCIVGDNGLSYTLGEGECYYPNLEYDKGMNYSIGKYGRMRERYLRENKRQEWLQMYLKETLYQHLYEVDMECWERIEEFVSKMKPKYGVTEELKRVDGIQWVGLVNNLRSMAEEIVVGEVVYR